MENPEAPEAYPAQPGTKTGDKRVMGKTLDWVREEATGRLLFRRAYPKSLRPFLEKPGQRELKIPLGARRRMTVGAWQAYEAAQRQYERNVEHARAAQRVDVRHAAGLFDPLTPELSAYLIGAWKAEHLALDEEVRWLPRSRQAKQKARQQHLLHITEDLEEARELRALGDLDAIQEIWGDAALSHARGLGFHIDAAAPEFARYVKGIHDAQIETWEAIMDRLSGLDIPTPAEPTAPPKAAPGPALEVRAAATATDGQSFQAIVEGLFEATRRPMSETTKEGVRTALRLFRETHGTPRPGEITRAMVSDWLDLLVQRPSKLPIADRAAPLPGLVEKYRDRPDVPRLSPKTIAQHLSMLAARWPQARRAGRIGAELANPFEDHDLERSKARTAPLGFSEEEARAIYSLPVFTQGTRPLGGKGEASYWLPLLLLFTGARPEEIAQLRVDDIFEDAGAGRWLLRITDEGTHPHKGRQSLKTTKRQSGRRTFPVPQPLLDLGLLDYVRHLQKAGEEALFPRLRTKGKRGLLFAGFGDWWRGYLEAQGVRLAGVGRQPARETRHTWSTAARRSGIPRESMAYIQGHALPDATAGEGYGDLNPLGAAIDKLEYPWFGDIGVRAWARPGSKRPR
jgi:integrase